MNPERRLSAINTILAQAVLRIIAKKEHENASSDQENRKNSTHRNTEKKFRARKNGVKHTNPK